MKREDLSFFGPRRPSFMRHHLTTSRIVSAGPDEATARTYFINYSDIGADHAGVYVDRFRRIDGTWLIARRDDRVDWLAESSLYVRSVERREGTDGMSLGRSRGSPKN